MTSNEALRITIILLLPERWLLPLAPSPPLLSSHTLALHLIYLPPLPSFTATARLSWNYLWIAPQVGDSVVHNGWCEKE